MIMVAISWRRIGIGGVVQTMVEEEGLYRELAFRQVPRCHVTHATWTAGPIVTWTYADESEYVVADSRTFFVPESVVFSGNIRAHTQVKWLKQSPTCGPTGTAM